MGARRCVGRCDGRRLPGTAGDGVCDGGRTAAGGRVVGCAGAAGRVRGARVVAATVGRSGVHDGPDDRNGVGTARARRPPALRRAGGCSGAPCRRDLFRRRPDADRIPCRPAVAAGPRRLHDRRRGDHDRRPARQDHRHFGRGRRIRRPDSVVRRRARRCALADGHAGSRGTRRAARAGPAGAAAAWPADRDPARDCCRRAFLTGPQRHSGDRRHPGRTAGTRPARCRSGRCLCAADSCGGNRDRGVLRQCADRTHLRGEARPARRRQRRVACTRRLQCRNRSAARISGEFQWQPHRLG